MPGGSLNYKSQEEKLTVNLTKKLIKNIEALQLNLEQEIAEKLKETHKQNVVASYHPRARIEREGALSYQHTGILEEAIDVKTEKKSQHESKVSVIVRPYPYPQDHFRTDGKHVTAVDVYQWLREGTKGGDDYWFTNSEGKRPTARNYPTPAHLFEQHTRIQMRGFLDDLIRDISNGKYSRQRR